MKSLPVFETDSHRRTRRRRQWYRLALVCLAVLVAGATGYALIHPAITMTGTAHTHDASCYTQIVSKTEQALSCTFAQAHAEDTARILHLHDQNCYDAAGMLVCLLEEAEAHAHTEAAMRRRRRIRTRRTAMRGSRASWSAAKRKPKRTSTRTTAMHGQKYLSAGWTKARLPSRS